MHKYHLKLNIERSPFSIAYSVTHFPVIPVPPNIAILDIIVTKREKNCCVIASTFDNNVVYHYLEMLYSKKLLGDERTLH